LIIRAGNEIGHFRLVWWQKNGMEKWLGTRLGNCGEGQALRQWWWQWEQEANLRDGEADCPLRINEMDE
jgi:hypothetical protein